MIYTWHQLKTTEKYKSHNMSLESYLKMKQWVYTGPLEVKRLILMVHWSLNLTQKEIYYQISVNKPFSIRDLPSRTFWLFSTWWVKGFSNIVIYYQTLPIFDNIKINHY